MQRNAIQCNAMMIVAEKQACACSVCLRVLKKRLRAHLLMLIDSTWYAWRQVDGEQHPLKFSQVFQLMPSPQGSYYVLNDIFRLNYA